MTGPACVRIDPTQHARSRSARGASLWTRIASPKVYRRRAPPFPYPPPISIEARRPKTRRRHGQAHGHAPCVLALIGGGGNRPAWRCVERRTDRHGLGFVYGCGPPSRKKARDSTRRRFVVVKAACPLLLVADRSLSFLSTLQQARPRRSRVFTATPHTPTHTGHIFWGGRRRLVGRGTKRRPWR